MQENDDLRDALRDLLEFLERVIYAILAFVATSSVMRYGFGFEFNETVEAAMLNAGIAYYTHAATGKVIRALYKISKPPARKCADLIRRERRGEGTVPDRDSVQDET